MARDYKLWSGADIDELTRLYPDYTASYIAKALGRSVASIHYKAGQLSLKKSSEFYKRGKDRE